MGQQTVDYRDGVCVIRDDDARTEHNPEGITLEAIDTEIKLAKTLGQVDGTAFLQLAMQKLIVPRRRSRTTSLDPTTDQVMPLRVTPPEEMLEPYDEDLADMIRKCPIALLESEDHQRAIARWFYVQRIAKDESVRARASELIERSAPASGPGHPTEFDVDVAQLAQADRDLRAYRDAVRSCMQATKSADAVMKAFSECEHIKTLLGEACASVAHIAKRGGTGLPGAQPFSHAYLMDRMDCSRSTIEKWLYSGQRPINS